MEKEPYTVRDGVPYVKDQDVLGFDKWLIPINLWNVHWVLIKVDLKNCLIELNNPLPKKQASYPEIGMVLWFIVDVGMVRDVPIDVSKWY